jgi:two-component system sensor histidine kinase YesM
MLSYERLETNDWVIVNGVPLKSIMTGTELMKRMIFVLVIMMLLIASVPLLILSHWMSRDIVGLACQIEEYQIGNKEANFHTRDQKELKQVAGALNQFVKTIQDQITGMMESETRKRKAELRLLQSQINPHFLYNTLISVKTLIDMQRYQQASDMFQSLIDFYVIGLNHGQELISVRKELETIRNYLSILEVRYNNSFEWMINVDEDVLDCEILTLTLQPLVENAIQHGVNNKTEKGMIDISGCSYEDTVILTVWDNGQGIREETLDELREELIRKELPENRKDTHFGLWNSNQRLKLYFGEEYGIEIDSEYGKYTSVTVRIRNRKYGE